MQKTNTLRPLRLFSGLVALLLCLTGCSGGSAGSSYSEASYAQSLYNSRVASVEDSAGMNSLFSQLGIESRMGPFTTELEKREDASNTLTLKFQQVPEDTNVFQDQFEYYAVLILALVGDCGQVRGTCPSADGSDSRSMEWDLKQASDRLNLDVASSGRSADGIATLLDTIRSAHGDNANFAALYEDA